ncbi:hypothetical protein [Thermomonas aquatica]|uniref:Uncharacterized protein n=1 Tax=Thermomonas aquatica TaxID=2202149 RepID=A0A5B7ZSI1_9GAMM|nr:hypothetical protein [Thermomonas aquatica]QDA57878.1 hypothetical protein FHQ07_11450 [Thermomonas aquatica]
MHRNPRRKRRGFFVSGCARSAKDDRRGKVRAFFAQTGLCDAQSAAMPQLRRAAFRFRAAGARVPFRRRGLRARRVRSRACRIEKTFVFPIFFAMRMIHASNRARVANALPRAPGGCGRRARVAGADFFLRQVVDS